MKSYLWILISLCMFSVTSCDKDEVKLASSDYLIFGHFYGECGGETCIEIFRLETDRLLEDTKDQYPNSSNFYQGTYTPLSQQKFEATKDLTANFPSDLLTETKTVIGQPDAGDWGGLYVEYNFDGVRKFWLLDQLKTNVPEKYHSFIDKINEKIKQLQ